MGYYVKYRYGKEGSITFSLSETESKVDGWIYRNDAQIESVQIVIAYYEQEEANIDQKRMSGEHVIPAGWVGDRMNLLQDRVKKRITKKTTMVYQDIDTLLIGVRSLFVYRINNEYAEQKENIVKCIESVIPNSNFRQIALVDADFVGKGELLIVPNDRLNLTDRSSAAPCDKVIGVAG